MSSDLANLENAELKEAFDAFDKVSETRSGYILSIHIHHPGWERNNLFRGAAGGDESDGTESNRGRAPQSCAGG